VSAPIDQGVTGQGVTGQGVTGQGAIGGYPSLWLACHPMT